MTRSSTASKLKAATGALGEADVEEVNRLLGAN